MRRGFLILVSATPRLVPERVSTLYDTPELKDRLRKGVLGKLPMGPARTEDGRRKTEGRRRRPSARAARKGRACGQRVHGDLAARQAEGVVELRARSAFERNPAEVFGHDDCPLLKYSFVVEPYVSEKRRLKWTRLQSEEEVSAAIVDDQPAISPLHGENDSSPPNVCQSEYGNLNRDRRESVDGARARIPMGSAGPVEAQRRQRGPPGPPGPLPPGPPK